MYENVILKTVQFLALKEMQNKMSQLSLHSPASPQKDAAVLFSQEDMFSVIVTSIVTLFPIEISIRELTALFQIQNRTPSG